MKASTIHFASEDQAHARIAQLCAQLGIAAETPETINESWERIEALEDQLAARASAPAPQPTPTAARVAPTPAPTATHPKAPNVSAHYVGGLARSIAANTGEKPPAPTTKGTELTGIARAAAANAKLQSRR
jgi:hypothetical protein